MSKKQCTYLNLKNTLLLKNANHYQVTQGCHKPSICKKQNRTKNHSILNCSKGKHNKTRYAYILFYAISLGKEFSSVQLLSHVQLFATPWTAAGQASLSITSSQSLLKLMSIELVMPSNHLILCHPFLLPPSIFPSIRVFSNESVLHIRWPKYWSFSISQYNLGFHS